MSNEKRAPGCLGYIRDEILPNYMGIISETVIIHGSLLNNQYFMDFVRLFFFVAHIFFGHEKRRVF